MNFKLNILKVKQASNMLLYKFRRKIIKSIDKVFNPPFFFKLHFNYDLLIWDDIFPHPISGFRFEEFSVLLKEFNNSKIILTASSYPLVKTDIGKHRDHIEEYENRYSQLRGKLLSNKSFVNVNAKLFYCVFINNIYTNLYWLEKHKIPFVFTLYPGGGFQVDEETSDVKLKRVFSSPQFRQVIVTQIYTKDYLLQKDLCPSEKVNYIFGGVVPQVSLKKEVFEKKYYLNGKDTFDICFCAAKYMSKGIDKGYDVFVEAAISLATQFDFVRFHVIGGFNKDEIDVVALGDRVEFYGYQDFEELSALYQQMDVIVSPNKPFFLGRGAFDGFPLGAIVEAVLNGVVALVSDKLKQNTVFVDQEEIVIIESSVESIKMEISNLINNPDKLYSLSNKGRKKFLKVYSNDFQMKPRIALLQDEIKKR